MVEAAEQVHEGRLAGARWPHDRDELAGFDVDRDAAQGMHHRAAHLVVLRQRGRADQRHAGNTARAAPGRGLAMDCAAAPPIVAYCSDDDLHPFADALAADFGGGAVGDAGLHLDGLRPAVCIDDPDAARRLAATHRAGARRGSCRPGWTFARLALGLEAQRGVRQP